MNSPGVALKSQVLIHDETQDVGMHLPAAGWLFGSVVGFCVFVLILFLIPPHLALWVLWIMTML